MGSIGKNNNHNNKIMMIITRIIVIMLLLLIIIIKIRTTKIIIKATSGLPSSIFPLTHFDV